MTENFIRLEEIESITYFEEYVNMIDLSIEEDESFVLSNGVISHNSAKSAFRKFRNPSTMGAFPLRGKFINVMEIPVKKIMENEEATNLMASMGLNIFTKAVDFVEGEKVKLKLNDGEIIVDINDQILINDKWIEVKNLK